MNDGNAELLFHIAFAMIFIAAMMWMFAIFSRNITSRVPFVVVPVVVGLFSFASWLLFDNAIEKVIALPIMTLVIVFMFRSIFRRIAKEGMPRSLH